MSLRESHSLLRDPETRIRYLGNKLESLTSYVEAERRNGVIGYPSLDLNDERLVDALAIDLHQRVRRETDRINLLGASKKTSKSATIISILSFFRDRVRAGRQAENIINSIQRTYALTVKTTARRHAHNVIYHCAFLERFPPDSERKEGSPFRENLDSIYEQSLALMSCCRTMASLLEGIEEKEITFSGSARDCEGLMENIANALVRTVGVRRIRPSLLARILEKADITLHCATDLTKVPKEHVSSFYEVTSKNLVSWKQSIGMAEELINSPVKTSLKSGEMPNRKTLFPFLTKNERKPSRRILVDLQKATRPFTFDNDADADDLFLESTKFLQGVQESSSGCPIQELPDSDQQFTFANITEKLPRLLKLPVCFTGPPSDCNTGAIIRFQERGGYGDVCEVQLCKPLEYPVATSRSDEPLTIETRSTSKVAVKYIRVKISIQRTCLRITREGRVWSKMKHRNILPLIGFWKAFLPGQESACLSFITPWIDDGDLLHYLKAHQEIGSRQRLKYLRDIASALSYMHNYTDDGPVVHGDLKANNVLVRGDEALLCDFGLSHLSDGIEGFTTEASTPWRWQAPERHKNPQLRPTPHSDMYSFGCVFLETFTADIPWKDVDYSSNTFPPRSHNSLQQLDRPPEIICEAHWKFIKACWKEEPYIRPTAKRACKDLGEFMERV